MTSFSATPLRLAFYLGLGIVGLSVMYAGVAVIAHFMGHTPPGWTSVLISVLAIGGLQTDVHRPHRGVPRARLR